MLKLTSEPTKNAVAYYRHSAEDKQENSVPIQRQHAQALAAQHGIKIIHEEADEGKSGLLGPEARPGFKRLLDDWIENDKAPPFDYVLVYDESRWGRFQNPDEAAYHEFRCTKRGKQVIYVASGFPKEEHRLISHLTTSIKRYMAAEYSRELSEKVFRGCVEVSKQGYSAGGTSCYGLARLLLDADKKPIRTLKKGEHKAISNGRVVFALASDKTTDTVREIFHLFVAKQKTPKDIATVLNSKEIPSANGGKWDHNKILRILVNEAYIGTRIYNKVWSRLKQKQRQNPRIEWVIVPKAFPAVIDSKIFQQAQERLALLKSERQKQVSHLIQRARSRVREVLMKFFLGRGMYEGDVLFALKRFPILYSVTLQGEPAAQWCFVIPDDMRGYNSVLGIGAVENPVDPLGRIFSIPTDDFGFGDFTLFSENDKDYSRYFVREEETEKKILSIAHTVGLE